MDVDLRAIQQPVVVRIGILRIRTGHHFFRIFESVAVRIAGSAVVAGPGRVEILAAPGSVAALAKVDQ